MTPSKKTTIIRAALLIIPIFIAWKLIVASVIIPIVHTTSGYVTEAFYSELKPELFFHQNTHDWQLKTALFKVDSPYPNNTFKINLQISSSTNIIIGKLEAFTLGLPLFWLLISLFSPKKWRHLVQGTVSLLALTCINVMLLVHYKVINYLQGSTLIRLYNEPYIQLPPAQPLWLIDVIKPLLDTLGYMSVLAIPVWLAFYYCQKCVQESTDESNDNERGLLPTEQSLPSPISSGK